MSPRYGIPCLCCKRTISVKTKDGDFDREGYVCDVCAPHFKHVPASCGCSWPCKHTGHYVRISLCPEEPGREHFHNALPQ